MKRLVKLPNFLHRIFYNSQTDSLSYGGDTKVAKIFTITD